MLYLIIPAIFKYMLIMLLIGHERGLMRIYNLKNTMLAQEQLLKEFQLFSNQSSQ